MPPSLTPTQIESLPLGQPRGLGNGEWYYKTKYALYVLRSVDDNRKRGLMMPSWAFVQWLGSAVIPIEEE
jgi:hypothetical protein